MIAAALAFSVAATVTVRDTRLVSSDIPSAQVVETTVAANPRDGHNLIAAAMVLGTTSTSVVVYATHDGGRTWSSGRPANGDDTRTDALDPWVTFTQDGTALFTYLHGRAGNNFAVSRSRDGGRTWSTPVFVPGGLYDRQFLVEDASATSAYNHRIYALGKVNVSRLAGPPFQLIAVSESSDGARTFSPPRLLAPPDDSDPLFIVAGGVTTRSGKLVVPFATVIRPQERDTTVRYTLWTTESKDGGRVFSPPHLVGRREVPRGEIQKYISVPSVAIDRSGPDGNGRVYLAWSVASNGGYTIQVWRSEDEGTTWLSGVSINDNAGPAGHVNPAVAVNARGAVAVVWYDRRDDPDGRCHRLFAAASIDGGRTFSANVPVTQEKTCVTSRRFANAGDTLGIAAGAGGRFYSLFISGQDTAAMQLYAVSFDVNGGR